MKGKWIAIEPLSDEDMASATIARGQVKAVTGSFVNINDIVYYLNAAHVIRRDETEYIIVNENQIICVVT